MAEEKSAKEALARQLKQEEELQKQEIEAATKAEQDRVKKDRRTNVVKKELAFNDALSKYRTSKRCAEDMTRFARELTKEQVVYQVTELPHVRSLPTYETKNKLLDRLKAACDAAIEYQDAIEEEVEYNGKCGLSSRLFKIYSCQG